MQRATSTSSDVGTPPPTMKSGNLHCRRSLIGDLDDPQSTLSRIVISRGNTKEKDSIAYYFEELTPAVIKVAVDD